MKAAADKRAIGALPDMRQVGGGSCRAYLVFMCVCVCVCVFECVCVRMCVSVCRVVRVGVRVGVRVRWTLLTRSAACGLGRLTRTTAGGCGSVLRHGRRYVWQVKCPRERTTFLLNRY